MQVSRNCGLFSYRRGFPRPKIETPNDSEKSGGKTFKFPHIQGDGQIGKGDSNAKSLICLKVKFSNTKANRNCYLLVRVQLSRQNSRVINLSLDDSKHPIDYGVAVHIRTE